MNLSEDNILRISADLCGFGGIFEIDSAKTWPALLPKSSWKPSLDNPDLEVFLGQVDEELFEATNLFVILT